MQIFVFQVLPITESGRSTPASQTSNVNVQEAQTPREIQAEVIVNNVANVANLVLDPPLIEVSEEEDEKSSSTTTLSHNSESSRASSVPKDIKESQNYEKINLALSTFSNHLSLVDGNGNNCLSYCLVMYDRADDRSIDILKLLVDKLPKQEIDR